MKRTAFKGNVVLADRVLENGLVVLEDDRIVGVHANAQHPLPREIQIHDYGSDYVVPGLIDLHFHGAMGKDIMDGDVAGLREIASYQVRHGVTGFVATTLAAPFPEIREAVESIRAALDESLPSGILGIHLEGPFLSLEKKGAQNPEHIRTIERADLPELRDICHGFKGIITIAPEAGDNLAFIPFLKEAGWLASIGHSAASYGLAMNSIERGISHATHLYNAMSGFLPREPGVIGAVLDSDGVTAELIADGVHVHPAALRMAVRQKGVERICLITDSLNAAGRGEGEYSVGGLNVVVADGEARLKESGALAGSILTLNKAVRNIVEWTGVAVPEAVRMASLNPARVLGLDGQRGSIEAGKLADLAVLDRDFNVVRTIVRGRSLNGWLGM